MHGNEPEAQRRGERSPARQGRTGGAIDAGSCEDGDRPVRLGPSPASVVSHRAGSQRGPGAPRAPQQVSGEAIDDLAVGDLLEIATGVLEDVAVRDAGLLAAAAARPLTTVFGQDAYPTFEDKAAALLHSLVRNHAL